MAEAAKCRQVVAECSIPEHGEPQIIRCGKHPDQVLGGYALCAEHVENLYERMGLSTRGKA